MNNCSGFYLRNNLPEPLTQEENERYFQLAKNGDENAKKKLEKHNLRFVTYITNKFFQTASKDNPTIDKDDLLGIGTIGLMKAIKTFDIEKEIKFTSYASTVISNEILMTFRKTKKTKNDVSLNDSLYDDENGNEILFNDILSSDNDTEKDYIQKETDLMIRNSLEILNDLERQIVELHYGFNKEPLTHKEIGKDLGKSQSYISRIDVQARKKIKNYLGDQGIIVTKKTPSDMEHIKKMNTNERASFYAKTIIDTNMTVEEMSKKIGTSSYSIRRVITTKLQSLDSELYNELNSVFEQQNQEKEQKRQKDRGLTKQLKQNWKCK